MCHLVRLLLLFSFQPWKFYMNMLNVLFSQIKCKRKPPLTFSDFFLKSTCCTLLNIPAVDVTRAREECCPADLW